MKKRLLIEGTQEHLIVCDHCNYKISNPTKDPYEDISMYLGVKCPKCGEILLTLKDYVAHVKVLNVVKWVNKWFGWVTLFIPEKKDKITIGVGKISG